MSEKKYNIIYADPPWQYKVYSEKGMGRSAESHYPWIMPKKVDRKSKRIIGQIGRQAIIMRMRTDRVIKAVDILKNSKL